MADSSDGPYVLTIDIGTSSVRLMLFDRFARAVPGQTVRLPFPLRTTPDGGVEADAEELFVSIVDGLDELLRRAGPLADQIGAVAADTLVSNVLGVDEHGRPLTPVYLWADTRCRAEAAELRQRFDERAVLDRTGCPIHPSYLPARLLWIQQCQPETFRSAWRWISIGELLYSRLLSDDRVSHSVASWTGLLDRRTLTWDGAWLDALGLGADRLGPLGDVGQPAGPLKPSYAARWPALRSAPWFLAIGDGVAANLGSGCVGTERVALTIGTSGALRAAVDTPVGRIPWGLWLYRVNLRWALLGGALSEGGNLIGWLGHALQLGEPAAVETELAAMPPDGHGLTVLPFISGERSPGWASEARATIVGIRLTTKPIELLRAGMEAIAYRVALIDRLLTEVIGADHAVVASGGALLHSPTWMQIVADVLGRPVVASAEPETTSRGTAVLALVSLGFLAAVAQAPPQLGGQFVPDLVRHKQYQAAIARQQELYQLLVGHE